MNGRGEPQPPALDLAQNKMANGSEANRSGQPAAVRIVDYERECGKSFLSSSDVYLWNVDSRLRLQSIIGRMARV